LTGRDAFGTEAQQLMTPDTFATQSLQPRDQLGAWREWFEPVLDVLPKHAPGDEFTAEMHIWKLGGLAMSRTIAPPVNVVRAKSNLRRDPVDHWVISYCARAAHLAQTAGAELEVPARVPFLRSLGQEFLHERTHVDRVQFFLARDAFRDIAPLLDGALGSTLDTPLGHLLGDYMMALERRLPVVTEADLPRLTNAVGAMVAAASGPIGRSRRRRQAANRRGPQGAGATGRPPAPAHSDSGAHEPLWAYRNVSI